MDFRAALLDRDGVINVDYGHVGTADRFKFCEGVFEAMRLLKSHGCKIFVVTNQTGIAKGLYSYNDYWILERFITSSLLDEGISIDGVYHCPHHPEGMIPELSISCMCRKPHPGMILQCLSDNGLRADECFLVGDKTSDIIAARSAGVSKTILLTTQRELSEITAVNLFEAVTLICGQN